MLAREKFSPGFESMSCLRKSLITTLLDPILISPVFGGGGGGEGVISFAHVFAFVTTSACVCSPFIL